jgi:hypothetical protein
MPQIPIGEQNRGVSERGVSSETPLTTGKMMIDGIPNRPLYFYQKDIIGGYQFWLVVWNMNFTFPSIRKNHPN